MKLFIDKDAEIKVEICVATVNGKVQCWPSDVKLDEKDPASSVSVEKHEIFFRIPTYKDNLLFMDSSFRVDGEGILSVVTNQLKFTRFATLLKSWTFKDEAGNPVPANENTANLLAPVVASVIIAELDKALSVG